MYSICGVYYIFFYAIFIRTEELIIAMAKLTVSIRDYLALCLYKFLNMYLKTSGHLTYKVHQLLSLSLKFLRGPSKPFLYGCVYNYHRHDISILRFSPIPRLKSHSV